MGLDEPKLCHSHLLDGGPALLRDVAMTTNFGTNIGINWFCVNTSDIGNIYILVMEGGLSGRPTECRYCRRPATKERCRGNRFWLYILVGSHWPHLANTTEPSMCGGDTALCQITLTTCYQTHKCHHSEMEPGLRVLGSPGQRFWSDRVTDQCVRLGV